MSNNVDYNFISQQEGGLQLTLYVPQQDGVAIADSGCTCAIGIDLGQTNSEALSSMGVSNDLVNILSPYCGLQKQDAISYLHQNPLTLTANQANELMNAEFDYRYTQLANLFDKYSDTNFEDLSQAEATVVFDIAFQYGLGLTHSCPKFWNAATSGLWNQVISILQNFGDRYPDRRNAEANLLINS